jgi:DNA-binding NarL/FixJ family response regulator
MRARRITVVAVDDQPSVRSELAVTLAAAAGIAGLAAVRAHRPDVMLLDTRMPGWTAWTWSGGSSPTRGAGGLVRA